MRLGMKHVLVSFCLSLAAVFAPTTPSLNPVDVAMRTANCIPSIVVARTDQRRSMRSLWTCRNGHRWSTLLPSHGLIYRRSIHRPRTLQQNRYCR